MENAEQWDPNKLNDPKIEVENEIKNIEDEIVKPGITSAEDGAEQLHFDTLDITAVVKNGKRLLGSSGKEYDYSLADLDPAERLALQKKNVTASTVASGRSLTTKEKFTDESRPRSC